jgi:hypothetical protein
MKKRFETAEKKIDRGPIVLSIDEYEGTPDLIKNKCPDDYILFLRKNNYYMSDDNCWCEDDHGTIIIYIVCDINGNLNLYESENDSYILKKEHYKNIDIIELYPKCIPFFKERGIYDLVKK